MKKRNVFFVITMIVSLFLFTNTVFAEDGETNTCSAKQLSELRQIASNVKVSYLPKTEIVENDYVDVETGATKYTKRYLDIKIYNMNTKLYVEVKNDDGYESVVSITELGDDGTITFRQAPLSKKVNYTFTIKSDAYGCETNVLRTIRMTLPMFNAYSQLDICAEIPDYYLCQEYVTQQVDGTTFYDRIATYKEKLDGQGEVAEDQNNTGTVNKIFKDASKIKYLIVGIIVVLGVVITIVIIKRKENK